MIDKAFYDHRIPKSTLERIYNLISNPKAIFKAAADNPGSVVLTYEVNKKNDPIIIPIHPNRPKTRTEYFNVVASIYPKETDGESIEVRWKRNGLLLWEPKEQ